MFDLNRLPYQVKFAKDKVQKAFLSFQIKFPTNTSFLLPTLPSKDHFDLDLVSIWREETQPPSSGLLSSSLFRSLILSLRPAPDGSCPSEPRPITRKLWHWYVSQSKSACYVEGLGNNLPEHSHRYRFRNNILLCRCDAEGQSRNSSQ